MRFLNPAGLWLLLGIPALIIIYLIKAQHEDRNVSSTYIWQLSAKFMKKRLPVQKLKKILLFLMQLTAIAAIAFIAARPAIADGDVIDYVVIIDASASMNIKDENGVSRFEEAVAEAKELAKETEKGHTFSVILASDSASYLVQQSTSLNEINIVLENAACALGDCDVNDALTLAELFCSRSNNPKAVFYTDKTYEAQNIETVNLDRGEANVSVVSLASKKSGKNTIFTGELLSRNTDESVAVGLKIDGKTTEAQFVDCKAGQVTEVAFEAEGVSDYENAEIFIDVKDGFDEDNSYVLCQKSEKTANVLLVSSSSLYLESALNALGNCKVTLSSALRGELLTGYDIYVFDGIYPDSYPTDGSVIQFGTGSLPEGLSAGERINAEAALGKDLTKAHDITTGLVFDETAICSYVPLVGNVHWENVLFCGDDAVMSVKKTDNGKTVCVVSFDLHDSNLPMQMDYVVLMRNLVEYAFPGILSSTDKTVGQSVRINVLPTAEKMYLEYPDDTVKMLSTASDTVSVVVPQVGVYTAVATVGDGGEYADFFVHVPMSEMQEYDGGAIKLEIGEPDESAAEDAVAELWFWIAAALILLILLEWGVYYREQY